MIRESMIMKIHYATALGSVALVAIHVLFRLTQNFHDSLKFDNVITNYSLLPYSILLELILILISIHGFNGLRVILLELNQGQKYETIITYGCLASMIALITYGSRTILMTSMGMI